MEANIIRIKNKSNLLKEGTTGLFISIQCIVYTLAYVIIIFSGDLDNYITFGITVAFISSILILTIVSLKGSVPIIIASVQDIYSVIASLLVAAISAELLANYSHVDPLPTIMIALMSLTVLFGIWLYLLGKYRLGNLVRFIPYPVIGGFLAATGWLLFKASFKVITSIPLTFSNLPTLFFNPVSWYALGGLAYAALMLIVLARYKQPIIMFGFLLLALIGFYLVLFVKGISLQQAQEMHLTLESVKYSASKGVHNIPYIFQLNRNSLSQIQWHLLIDQIGQYLAFFVIGSIALLLNMSGFELIAQRELNINKDLKVIGNANIFAGILGGMGGYTMLSTSALNRSLGAKTAIPACVAAAVMAIILLTGSSSFLGLLPRFVFGILIFYTSLQFLYQWLILSWKRFPWTDYFILLVIFVSITSFNLLTGFIIGLILAGIIFVVRYSQIKIIKVVFNGSTLKSNVERAPKEERLLKKRGETSHILVLQGYLYFGNINYLLKNIKTRLKNKEVPLKFIVIDCYAVNGVDSSAILGFIKIIQLAKRNKMEIVFTEMYKWIKHQLDEAIKDYDSSLTYRTFPDLDHGLEWFEEKVIAMTKKKSQIKTATSSTDELRTIIDAIQAADPYFSRIVIKANEIIYNINDEADSFYYIESGKVDVFLPHKGKEGIRLRSMHAGTIIGEIGMFSQLSRTAVVRASNDCVLLRLTQKKLLELEEKEPHLANALHKQIIIILGHRLNYSNQLLRKLRVLS